MSKARNQGKAVSGVSFEEYLDAKIVLQKLTGSYEFITAAERKSIKNFVENLDYKK